MKVLILSARAPVALEWAQHFQAASWEVFLSDHQVGHLSHQNTFPHTFIATPSPKHQTRAYIDALKDIVHRYHIDWVMPTCEEIFYLAYFKHEFPSFCHVYCANFELLKSLHHKSEFQHLAKRIGMRTPSSQLLSSADDVLWQHTRKRVLKPVYSRFGHQVLFLPAYTPVPKHIPTDGSWLLQRWQTGQELCSFSLAVSGRLLAHQSYVGQYRYKKGASFYFDPIEQDDIYNQVCDLVAKTEFTGQIGFDWMVDNQQRACVLECNPRGTSGLHLFPKDVSLVTSLIEEKVLENFQARAKMLAPMMWAVALPDALKQGLFRKWWQDYLRADDVLGHWQHHLGAGHDFFEFYKMAKRLNISIEAASSVDFEFNGNI